MKKLVLAAAAVALLAVAPALSQEEQEETQAQEDSSGEGEAQEGESESSDDESKPVWDHGDNVSKLMEATGKSSCIFMHCLPAVKGQEVSEDIFEGKMSRVWDEAENRKHTIKAILLALV